MISLLGKLNYPQTLPLGYHFKTGEVIEYSRHIWVVTYVGIDGVSVVTQGERLNAGWLSQPSSVPHRLIGHEEVSEEEMDRGREYLMGMGIL